MKTTRTFYLSSECYLTQPLILNWERLLCTNTKKRELPMKRAEQVICCRLIMPKTTLIAHFTKLCVTALGACVCLGLRKHD